MSNFNIFVYDEFGPEDTAMMQALYSRSSKSVETHVNQVKKRGSGKFMETYYVGYGHSSIADCGSTTVFIEQVSMLVAKAIQQWPLYSGQETSSRYIDYSQQSMIDPLRSAEGRAIQQRWLDFYTESQEALAEHVKKTFPKGEKEKQKMYDKAVQARVFDILRGFLPSGVTTQLSWHTNLRQAADKLAELRHHPLTEVRNVASVMFDRIYSKYPTSFGHKRYEESEEYRKYYSENYTYFEPEYPSTGFGYSTDIKAEELLKYKDLLEKRPAKTNLPQFMADLGNFTFNFPMDFGSFRDLQRHRNGVCRMPLITTKHGFNQWYLDQLSPELRLKADKLIQEQTEAIAKLEGSAEDIQYYIAMGFNIPCQVTYGLPATLYVIELRSGRTVHPTCRSVAHKMYQAVAETFPFVKQYADLSEDDWDVRRGAQDITLK